MAADCIKVVATICLPSAWAPHKVRLRRQHCASCDLQAASEASESLAAERASWRRDEAAIRAAAAAEEARLRERLATAEAQLAATAAFRERERAMEVDAAVLQDAVTQLQGELLEQACNSCSMTALL